MKWLAIITIVGIAVLAVVVVGVLCKRAARRKLAGRPCRSSLDFGRTFYPSHAEVAAQLRDILAEHLPVDLSQLEPTDQPVADLHMDDLDSMSTVEFVVELEEKFGINIADGDAEKMRTFDDVCRHVIAKLEGKKVGNKPSHHTA